MNNWTFISKGGDDPYINLLAAGVNSTVVNSDKYDYKHDYDMNPIVMRGILKKKIIYKCWETGRTFYYVDTGYFGNERTSKNPNGWKYWHRIVKNDLQHNKITERPSDRFSIFKRSFKPWNKDGRAIMIAAPDEKPMKFYGLDLEQWIKDTTAEIKKHTDRPIVVRARNKNRIERIQEDTLQEALVKQNVFALVTFNSVAATEAIFNGIPAFSLAPSNAANPVSSNDLSQIENPYYPSQDKLQAWGNHLSYGQFHVDEMRSGKAHRILEELW